MKKSPTRSKSIMIKTLSDQVSHVTINAPNAFLAFKQS